jgi:hypothetical protein
MANGHNLDVSYPLTFHLLFAYPLILLQLVVVVVVAVLLLLLLL